MTERRVVADFGAIGQVDVRFHLEAYPRDPTHKGRCKGKAPLYAKGSYRGVVEFPDVAGGDGVSVSHGPVSFKRHFKHVCKRRQPQVKHGPFSKLKRSLEESVLTVSGKEGGRTLQLQAVVYAVKSEPRHRRGTFFAAVHERTEGVRITRTEGGFFGRQAVFVSRRGTKPETVELELPAPFSGRGGYTRGSGSPPTWTGDLSVRLAGEEMVSLAGPSFSAVLCRGRVDKCL